MEIAPLSGPLGAEVRAALTAYKVLAFRDQELTPEQRVALSWRAGALAIWDNRCTQHLAVNDHDGQRRLLHRTTVAGERPR